MKVWTGRAALPVLLFIIATALAIYIMARGLGLDSSLDFGAGAYYYADMPGFERWTDRTYYVSQTPRWVLIALFLMWGAFMYRLWLRLDSKGEK
ncbi:MAG: hypothetical protein IJ702_04240 [Fretibacterium sp.]|nr:hypothetical protein [Fretibacterium sp.]